MITKHYILLSATMIAAVLVGCQKKAGTEPHASETVEEKTFYCSTAGGEKTTLASDFNTLWTAGDEISVVSGYKEGDKGTRFTLTAGAGTSYGEFSGSTATTGPYVAVYYPSSQVYGVWGPTAVIGLSQTQTITEAGTFAPGSVPMVAYSENDFLNFKNVGSLLCLSVKTKSGSATLSKIELMGNNGEYLAGTFNIDTNDSQPKAECSDPEHAMSTLTVNCHNITLNDNTPTNLYIFVPAGVFTYGFTATLYRDDDYVSMISTSDNLTTEVSKGILYSADVKFSICRDCEYTETLDYCGYRYNLVTIAGKTWFAENLRCDKYADGIAVPTDAQWEWDYSPYYVDNGDYGYLYSWAAAMKYDAEHAEGQTGDYGGICQGICPTGFHLPSRQEFSALNNAAKGDDDMPGMHLKTCSGWDSRGNGYNETCFSALPAGLAIGGISIFGGSNAYFWSSDASSSEYGYDWSLYFYDTNFFEYERSKQNAVSVRCVKD